MNKGGGDRGEILVPNMPPYVAVLYCEATTRIAEPEKLRKNPCRGVAWGAAWTAIQHQVGTERWRKQNRVSERSVRLAGAVTGRRRKKQYQKT